MRLKRTGGVCSGLAGIGEQCRLDETAPVSQDFGLGSLRKTRNHNGGYSQRSILRRLLLGEMDCKGGRPRAGASGRLLWRRFISSAGRRDQERPRSRAYSVTSFPRRSSAKTSGSPHLALRYAPSKAIQMRRRDAAASWHRSPFSSSAWEFRSCSISEATPQRTEHGCERFSKPQMRSMSCTSFLRVTNGAFRTSIAETRRSRPASIGGA